MTAADFVKRLRMTRKLRTGLGVAGVWVAVIGVMFGCGYALATAIEKQEAASFGVSVEEFQAYEQAREAKLRAARRAVIMAEIQESQQR